MIKKYNYDPEKHACCYDCSLPYENSKWVDVVVSDFDWELINPSYYKGGGLLCFNCMMARFVDIGKDNVQILGMYSGRIKHFAFVK